MITVSEIKRLKRGHYSVITDNGVFAVTEAMLADYHLYKGQHLDENQIDEMTADYNKRCCYQAALRLVARRDHFVAELRQKLQQRDYSEVDIDYSLAKLSETGYLNEKKYAALLVAGYCASESKRGLRNRLLKKGCPAAIVEQALADCAIDEVANASQLLKKRIARLSGSQIREQREKLMHYLMRRGFDYGVVKRSYQTVIDDLEKMCN